MLTAKFEGCDMNSFLKSAGVNEDKAAIEAFECRRDQSDCQPDLGVVMGKPGDREKTREKIITVCYIECTSFTLFRRNHPFLKFR